MKKCFGQHGWKEFHRNRKNILDEYRKLIDLTENRPIKVAHGIAVEAHIRGWLSDFLPKKYGVTSGYIIPDIYGDGTPIYHFDIIVYDRLEAPILWTEGNEDDSEQGKYRAIPAKHVAAVYEVKSRLTKKYTKDALEKLSQVHAFKEQLPENYSSGIIFIELKESDNNSKPIIKSLHQGKDVYGFAGGLVLVYENDDTATGKIELFRSAGDASTEDQVILPLAKKIDDINIYQTEDGNVTLGERGAGAIAVRTSNNTWSISKTYGARYDQNGVSVYLNWSRSNFSRFSVDLLSRLEGLAYNDERRPSFGMIFDSLRQEKAGAQSVTLRENYPFLVVSLQSGGPLGERHIVTFDGEEARVTFWVEVANNGSTEAILSDDRFKTSVTLPPAKKAIRKIDFQVSRNDSSGSPRERMAAEGLEMPYRLLYKAGPEGKELFSIEKLVIVKQDEIYLRDPAE